MVITLDLPEEYRTAYNDLYMLLLRMQNELKENYRALERVELVVKISGRQVVLYKDWAIDTHTSDDGTQMNLLLRLARSLPLQKLKETIQLELNRLADTFD